jgi:hypothetical protein
VVAKRALAETLQQVVARRTQETDVEVRQQLHGLLACLMC